LLVVSGKPTTDIQANNIIFSQGVSNIELPTSTYRQFPCYSQDGISENNGVACQKSSRTWSTQRLAEGWKYGPQRDDAKKEHPGLVSYEDLPESEKEYDRAISVGAIETLLALGYRIEEAEGVDIKPPTVGDRGK